MKYFLLSLCLLSAFVSRATPMPRELKAACDSLDYYIEHRNDYLAPGKRVLDSLLRAETHAHTRPYAEQMQLFKALGNNYRSVDLDSAVLYYNKAIDAGLAQASSDINLRSDLLKLRLRRDALLPLQGITYEAITDFHDINPDSLENREQRQIYFQGGIDIFTNISAIYPPGELRDAYAGQAAVYVDSLLKYVRPHGLSYRFTNAHRWKLTGEHSEAIAELMDTLPYLANDPAMYATGASLVARYYSEREDRDDEFLYYQTLSAINDIKAGHREVTSLQRLGKEWFDRGNVERAYRYLSLALDQAVESGSAARVLESSQSLPLISRSASNQDERNKRQLITMLVTLIIALIIILIMTSFLYRDHRRAQSVSRHLEQLNKSKDFYIQNVMMLCSVFFERLDEFNRYVARKIKANQVKDLYDSIESRKYLATQTEEFFKSFDSTFRTIHPNFVNQLNSILREDRRLAVPEPGEPMSPELRIAAFMRLGIDDSAILAKFLNLSLNTIYTYRNRLKNRAIDRQNFDEDIKHLGF